MSNATEPRPQRYSPTQLTFDVIRFLTRTAGLEPTLLGSGRRAFAAAADLLAELNIDPDDSAPLGPPAVTR